MVRNGLGNYKDTWEAIIFILYAITWGEIRKKMIDCKSCKIHRIKASGATTYEKFNSDRLVTNALKLKIENIKAIVQYSKEAGLNLKCEHISIELLDELSTLQDIRNDISHHAAPTKEQAESELKLVAPVFESMIKRGRFLENCKILRFDSYSTKCKCELFNGHALNKEFELIDVTGEDRDYIINLGTEQLFVAWENEYFSISPFLHFVTDESGHESYLCFYKGKKESKFRYEPVKLRTERCFDTLQPRFNKEKDDIVKLFT